MTAVITKSATTGFVARLAPRTWVLPLGIYFATRVVDAFLIAYTSTLQVSRGFDEGAMVVEPTPASPGYLTALTNWDGQWYKLIAEQGYPSDLPREDGEVTQNAWAFYPLYPMVVRALMLVWGLPFAVAATIVSTLCGAVAVVLVFKMVESAGGRFNATVTITALCTYAAAPVLQAAYTESLTLLLIGASLWQLRARRYGWLAVCAVLLALTRPVVLPLAAVIALHWLVRWHKRREMSFPVRERLACLAAGGVATISFLAWPAVVWASTGERNAYFLSHQAWMLGEGASGWPTWLRHLLGAGERTPAVLAFCGLAAVLLIAAQRRARAWGFELRAWVPMYVLYIVGSTRPTSSIIRYGLLAIVPWWPRPLDPVEPVPRSVRVTILTGVTIFGFVTQFFWLYWFFIPHTGSLGFP